MLCLLAVVCYSLCMSSCDDHQFNDWPVDPSTSRLFLPLVFETQQVAATSLQIRYSKVVTANRYVFEFYKDSLEFNPANLWRTDTIYVDTLTVYKEDSTPARVEYCTTFEELSGSTQYSVRMMGISADGKASGYISEAFQTKAEQLFTGVVSTTESATLKWTKTQRVTHLLLSEYKQLLNETTGTTDWGYDEPQRLDLTAEDIETAEKTLTDLPSGTSYRVQICNEDEVRGTYSFKTLGLGAGVTVRIPYESETGGQIDLNTIVNKREDINGASNLTLEFEPGHTYDLTNWNLPAVDNILLTSTTSDLSDMPVLKLKRITPTSTIVSLQFQGVKVDAQTESYFYQPGTGKGVTSFVVEGCHFYNLNRSLFRSSGGLNMTNITINNSILQTIGTTGYGLINISGTNTIDRIEITNTTLWDMGDKLMDLYGGIGDIIFKNNTLYQPQEASNKNGLGYLFNLRNGNSTPQSPNTVTIEGCILAGPNKGKALNPTNRSYSYVSFSNNCYMTSDFTTGKISYEGITELDLSSDDLFVDPVNGDFHFKSGIPSYLKVVGDPRWQE